MHLARGDNVALFNGIIVLQARYGLLANSQVRNCLPIFVPPLHGHFDHIRHRVTPSTLKACTKKHFSLHKACDHLKGVAL